MAENILRIKERLRASYLYVKAVTVEIEEVEKCETTYVYNVKKNP